MLHRAEHTCFLSSQPQAHSFSQQLLCYGRQEQLHNALWAGRSRATVPNPTLSKFAGSAGGKANNNGAQTVNAGAEKSKYVKR